MVRAFKLQDPPTIKQKGHPRSQRLTGTLEGRAGGGGGSILRSRQASGANPSRRVRCVSYERA